MASTGFDLWTKKNVPLNRRLLNSGEEFPLIEFMTIEENDF